MSMMVPQITGASIVCSAIYSGAGFPQGLENLENLEK